MGTSTQLVLRIVYNPEGRERRKAYVAPRVPLSPSYRQPPRSEPVEARMAASGHLGVGWEAPGSHGSYGGTAQTGGSGSRVS